MNMRVKIIAPSSKPHEGNEKLLSDSITILTKYGFDVTVIPNLFCNGEFSWYANSYQARLQDLQDAFKDDTVDIIWAIRGGAGAAELLPEMIKFKPTKPKLLIGFSDITALHVLANQFYNIPSLHAPVLSQLLKWEESHLNQHMIAIQKILQNQETAIKLTPLNELAARNVSINSKIIAGNLSIFMSLLGTNYSPKTMGRIVLLEDTNEPAYKLQRMLVQAAQAELFTKVSACLLGDFTGGDNEIELVLAKFAEKQIFPVYRIAEVGHGHTNWPVLCGSKAAINNNILTFKL